jgi:hypothetical protein
MGDDLAEANVNRSDSLAATSIAIFTFILFFLYPRFESGEINVQLRTQRVVTVHPLSRPDPPSGATHEPRHLQSLPPWGLRTPW